MASPRPTLARVHLRGPRDYREVHALQRDLVERRIRDEVPDTVLLLEHTDVLTVGRAKGAGANVISASGVPVVEVERGGDVTWHGPGQLVAYPIVLLEEDRRDLHRHLRALEDAVIAVLATLGLDGVRDARNTGVWLADEHGVRRKVASVGIACRRWVTWHGLALNVNPAPGTWDRIRPCGFDPDTMTSLSDHLAAPPALGDLVAPLGAALAETLGREPDAVNEA